MKYVVLFPAFILAGCTSQSFQEFFQTPAVAAETAATPPVIETLDPTAATATTARSAHSRAIRHNNG